MLFIKKHKDSGIYSLRKNGLIKIEDLQNIAFIIAPNKKIIFNFIASEPVAYHDTDYVEFLVCK